MSALNPAHSASNNSNSVLITRSPWARFAKGLRQGFGLFGRKMARLPQGAREPKCVEQKSGHDENMRWRDAKVQRGVPLFQIATHCR